MIAATRITDLPYIPNARDTRFGVVTRLGYLWCLACAETHADGRNSNHSDHMDHPDYRPDDRAYVYGGELTGRDTGALEGRAPLCEVCGHDLARDAESQQADHDAQQLGWSRMSRDVVEETACGGTFRFPGAIRCY